MDLMLDLLYRVMNSPWIYLVLFAVAVLDGFFPVVPSETSVITAGVFAATGQPDLLPVILVAAAGAMLGDHVSYAIGRSARHRLDPPDGTRRAAALAWARRALLARGGAVLIVARYVPGGRTAVTLTTGAIGFPLRSFVVFDAVAAVSWAVYSALVGYLGGMAFQRDPVKGLLLGLGFALTVAAVVEGVRYRRTRRSAHDFAEVAVSASPETATSVK